jgi:hypothetical protein
MDIRPRLDKKEWQYIQDKEAKRIMMVKSRKGLRMKWILRS